MLLKGLSPNKIETIVNNFILILSYQYFILNHINNSLIMQKLYMTLLVHKQ